MGKRGGYTVHVVAGNLSGKKMGGADRGTKEKKVGVGIKRGPVLCATVCTTANGGEVPFDGTGKRELDGGARLGVTGANRTWVQRPKKRGNRDPSRPLEGPCKVKKGGEEKRRISKPDLEGRVKEMRSLILMHKFPINEIGNVSNQPTGPKIVLREGN